MDRNKNYLLLIYYYWKLLNLCPCKLLFCIFCLFINIRKHYLSIYFFTELSYKEFLYDEGQIL